MSKDKNSLELCIRKLFEDTFISNCKLENTPISSEDLKDVMSLDINRIVDNLKLLISSLLSFKRSSISEDKSELIQRNEQFEMMLQKLEAEVRNHIRVEHQLKLHIESNQAEELESLQAKHITDPINPAKNTSKVRQVSKDHIECMEKIEMLEMKLSKKNSIIHKLELDFVKLKSNPLKNPRDSSLSKLKQKSDKNRKKELVEELKYKPDQNNPELQRLQYLLNYVKSTKIQETKSKPPKSDHRISRAKDSTKLVSNLLPNSHLRSESEQIRRSSPVRRVPST